MYPLLLKPVNPTAIQSRATANIRDLHVRYDTTITRTAMGTKATRNQSLLYNLFIVCLTYKLCILPCAYLEIP